jgi:hypothetical protein
MEGGFPGALPVLPAIFIPIRTLARRGGSQSFFTPLSVHPSLGVHHVALDAELLKPAVQMESKAARLVTGHNFLCEPLLFNDEQE